MSGATTELNLATAVDSDDNADYLTLSLANSLRTVDALFNNVTGHTHGGAHQGGPIVPANGSITSAMIADGTIVTADLADASVTNAKLGPDVARANLLTNGGFEVWQRGNGPFTANGGIGPDKWVLAFGAGSMSVVKDTSNQDASSSACAAINYTHVSTSSLYQSLKEFTSQFANRTVTASVRVRTSTANAVQINLNDSAGSNFSSFHSGGGAYETLTVTRTIAPGSSLLNFNIGLSASCTVYVDNATLVIGSQAANYTPLHPADELARCLRYYERIDRTSSGIVQAFAYGAGTAVFLCDYKAFKAVTPTITFSAPTAYTVANAVAAGVACTGISTMSVDTTGFQGLAQTAGGLVAGNASMLQAAASGASFTIEANP